MARDRTEYRCAAGYVWKSSNPFSFYPRIIKSLRREYATGEANDSGAELAHLISDDFGNALASGLHAIGPYQYRKPDTTVIH